MDSNFEDQKGDFAMIPFHLSRPLSRWFFGFLLLCITTGCGMSQSAAPQADPGQAEKTLRLVLDAWKAGENPADFSKRVPSIVINDMDWSTGLKLVAYKPQADARLAGNDMQYPVVLELKSPKGRIVKKQAVYTISTSPQLLVLRQDG